MNLKQELQQFHEKREKARRKLAAAELRGDKVVMAQFKLQIKELTDKIETVKGQQSRKLNADGEAIKALPFNRALTKAEQADMGKLKKAVKGIVVVHPMTALGREMGLKEVTGYAPAKF